ncbi:hypothetical protein [Streptomyces natalensis]|uniref:Uncharacterized protein n=1 Tax=Streptomyces natalensis ATCC 27448 TaxID=1240678 RepID=A0A0D7CQF4_9ACTN|nr:hypothetical protein [Streptomyces natalensis]KIZ18443.1 hypothetical protein SNA_07435 [Streptomyces natalensis ATCC 27448]
MPYTRHVLTGFALATALLATLPAPAAVAATEEDSTPITPHVVMPLGDFLTGHGTPANWSVLGVGLTPVAH